MQSRLRIITHQTDSSPIHFGFAQSPCGQCLFAWQQDVLLLLAFCPAVYRDDALADLLRLWPAACESRDDAVAARWAERIFHSNAPLTVLLKGTEFQQQVWQALLQIPAGATCSYADIAKAVGRPRAYRAVGSAVGANPVAWLIPCHRVLPAGGGLGNYRWGKETKQLLLEAETPEPT